VLSMRPEHADAAIELDFLGTPAAQDTADPDVHWRLRVVNAPGAVLWPASGSFRHHRGPLSLAAAETAQELTAALAMAQTPHSGRP
jgi:hypothetical protein